MTSPSQTARNETLLQIAKDELFLETLETRHMDDLDFSDQGVAGIKAALEAAWAGGYAAAKKGRRVVVA